MGPRCIFRPLAFALSLASTICFPYTHSFYPHSCNIFQPKTYFCLTILFIQKRHCAYITTVLWLSGLISLDWPHSLGFLYITVYYNLLTHSTVQSHSWAANWFADSQEIPRISRNPKVHFRTHKRPPPVSILAHPNPLHIPTSRLLEIHPNIIRPSTPRSPHLSFSLRFPHRDPIHPPSHPYTLHVAFKIM